MDWRRISLAVPIVLGLAALVFLLVSGARFDAAAVFVVISASLLGLCLLLLGGAMVALIREPEAAEVKRATGRRRKELEREKQLLLKALKELEFDRAMGKIAEADFAEITARYRGRAIQVMRQLDESAGDYRALIERDLKELKRGAGEPATMSASDAPQSPSAAELSEATRNAPHEMERPRALIADIAMPAAPAARWSCQACGTRNDDDALFCKRCGTPVGAGEVAS